MWKEEDRGRGRNGGFLGPWRAVGEKSVAGCMRQREKVESKRTLKTSRFVPRRVRSRNLRTEVAIFVFGLQDRTKGE
jgi:hypothetical protein